MGIPRYALSVMLRHVSNSWIVSAYTVDANYPICSAIKEQAVEETVTFLLGSVSKIRRKWKTQAGDDFSRVCANQLLIVFVLISFAATQYEMIL